MYKKEVDNMSSAKGRKKERLEALMRILVCIITGIILSIWKILICVLVVIQWIVALVAGVRHKEIAEFCEIFNSQVYAFLRYMTFVTNERPFPFKPLQKNLSHFRH
jgi:sorbitol-specific phosphotransferase system component IIC